MKLGSLCFVSALLLACGGDPSDSSDGSDGGGGTGNSTIDLGSGGSADGGGSPGGAGGTGASASGGGIAGESGGAASGGSGPDGSGGDGNLYPVPVCDPVPPACPEKILDGDLRVRELADFQEIEGVTIITGDLDIGSVELLSALDCLEQVGEKLLIDVEGSIAGILPRLRTVGYEVQLRSGGGIDIEDDPTSVDCALQSLVEVYGQGSIDTSRGLTGELDLSRLTQMRAVRIKSSHLSRIKFPSGLSIGSSQVAIRSNDELREVTGFEDMNLGDGASFTGESYVIAIEGNPLLSGCRVQELETYYRDAQYPESAFTIGSNGPGCE